MTGTGPIEGDATAQGLVEGVHSAGSEVDDILADISEIGGGVSGGSSDTAMSVADLNADMAKLGIAQGKMEAMKGASNLYGKQYQGAGSQLKNS